MENNLNPKKNLIKFIYYLNIFITVLTSVLIILMIYYIIKNPENLINAFNNTFDVIKELIKLKK